MKDNPPDDHNDWADEEWPDFPSSDMPEDEGDPTSVQGEQEAEVDPRARFRKLMAERAASEKDQAGENQVPKLQGDKRHPTGDPDETGGWFGEGDSPVDHLDPAWQVQALAELFDFEVPESFSDETRVSQPDDPANVPTVVSGDRFGGGEAPEPVWKKHDIGDTAPPEDIFQMETEPPPPLGTTPVPRRPAVDERGMPLPRRVDEIDQGATRVSPSAYTPPPAPPTRQVNAPVKPTREFVPAYGPASKPPRGQRFKRGLGCFVRLLVAGLFVVVVIALAGGSYALYHYYQISAALPSVDDLRGQTAQFETTRILDREGNLLYEIIDPSGGRRSYVKYENISPFLIAATIATEDKGYFAHPGFDSLAILRAFIQNAQSGETVSGASTITQQVARNLLLTEERYVRSYMRKVREALLAAEITRVYSKEEVLELYLNDNYYGNMAYGIQAASQTYFGVTADKLTLPQAAFLAGLPQAPSVYDVNTNREIVFRRLADVLTLMYQASQEQGCIFVGDRAKSVCVSDIQAVQAFQEIQAYPFKPATFQMQYPHWVTYVRSELEARYTSQEIYRSGFTVYTTIDPVLQAMAEDIVARQVAQLADRDAGNGALVAIRPNTGEILAMVGSADFGDAAIDGQVNMATAPRQPGSAIKPLTYVAAFEKGWTAATMIWDVPSEFPPSGNLSDPRPPYKPVTTMAASMAW